jgi:hypothetical protein
MADSNKNLLVVIHRLLTGLPEHELQGSEGSRKTAIFGRSDFGFAGPDLR